MAAKNLTALAIKNAKPGPHVTRLRDGKVKGLHLVIAPSGSKSWGLSYTSPETGKRRSLTLKPYPAMDLSQARTAATKAREQIGEGIDPKEADQREKAEENAREAGSFGNLLDLYVESLEARKASSAERVESELDRFVSQPLRDTPATAITRFDVMAVMEDVTKTARRRGRTGERAADLVRSYIGAAFKFAINATTDPKWRRKAEAFQSLETNPVLNVGKYQRMANIGERWLSPEEVRTLWSSIGVDALSADLAMFLKLSLALGGQRVRELLHAEWKEFTDDAWAIPFARRKLRTKARHKEPHLVPLTDFSRSLLDELRNLSPGKYLFPDYTGKAPRTDNALNQAICRYCQPEGRSKRTPFEKFSARDLRRTAKTLMGQAGLSKEIRDRIQGHAFGDVASQHYDRFDYWEDKTKAMAKWNRWLKQCVTGKSAKVVKLA